MRGVFEAMRGVFLLLLLVTGASVAQQPAATVQPRAVEVLRAFDKLAQKPLWPGFEPQKIAVEFYDGSNTYLYHHPKPPEGFQPVPDAPGVFVFAGQHDSVRANTGTELNGVPTATADISKDTRPPREVASLLIHESFHVYEKAAHPKWAANEAELFTYPFEDAGALELRWLETGRLVQALRTHANHQSLCEASDALRFRGLRFARLTPGPVAYEQGIELNEGLAQYVEYKSIRKAPALSGDDFPLEQIRQRAYATGQALALLLDRTGRDWKRQLGDQPLDVLLKDSIVVDKRCIAWGDSVPLLQRAEAAVQALKQTRAKRKQDFLAAPGWRLEIVAGKEPLWPQGFDPWNVQNLGSNDILHTRWVKLGNASGAIEVLNHASMSEGVGPHPLFNGAKRVIVTGLGEPKVTEAGGKVTIEAEGAKGTFTATAERSGQTVVVRLP